MDEDEDEEAKEIEEGDDGEKDRGEQNDDKEELDEGNDASGEEDSDSLDNRNTNSDEDEDTNFDECHQDLKTLKDHLSAGGKTADDKCLELKHKYKKGTETLLKTNFKELSNCAKDEFANVVIPPDVDLINPVAIKTLGNGNCLFNSASMFLRGVEDAPALLRLLTSIELHRNVAIYAYHDALSNSANSMRRSEKVFFQIW